MEEILTLRSVTKYYGGRSTVTKALDGISFGVARGEFVAVMGASGSGKSTLLNLIATLDRVSSGDIVIGGKSIADMSENETARFRRDRLGFVFQNYNLLDTLTAEENIVLPLNLRRVPRSETERALEKTARELNVAAFLKKFPCELSGGEKQRVACARALITSPDLILADEPTGALDSASSKMLMQTFSYMHSSLGATLLVVTHDQAVGSYADRVLFLKDGKLWSECYRGKRDRKELYAEIVSVSAALGGDCDVI